MISRRNFFAVTAVMVIIFFLFQSLNMAKEYWNDYGENAYAEDTAELPGESDIYTVSQESEDASLIVCIGDSKAGGTRMVSQWAEYAKWAFCSYPTLVQYDRAKQSGKIQTPKMLVIYPENIDWTDESETETLQSYVTEGINLVFAELPDTETIKKSPELRELLGIQKVVKDSTTVAGLHLYQGFLLGGETIYRAETEKEEKNQDMELTFPWYRLASGTKVYMKGIPEDKSVKTEKYPVVIWRKSFETAYVFAVNGDYMQDVAGLGVLTGMISEIDSYTIYPVVNAQNLVIANYPGFAEENEDEMQKLYSRSMRNLFRDVIWPSISAVYEQNNFGISYMMAPQFDYSDNLLPKAQDLDYYMKVINEQKGETGLSGYSVSDTDLPEKLQEDDRLLKEELPGYRFSSFYRADRSEKEVMEAIEQTSLKDIRTIVEPYDNESDLLGYQTEEITTQKMVIDGYEHTYRNDFKVKSIESALGYTGILLDLGRVAYPQEDTDVWEILSEEFAANTSTYWKAFQGFDGTTVSESDGRVRNFLALDYSQTRSGDEIHLTKQGTEETAWFILRTHNESVADVKGGSFKELEEGAWLIQAEKDQVTITLEPSDKRYYHE